jgi:hypothetical protein
MGKLMFEDSDPFVRVCIKLDEFRFKTLLIKESWE